MTSLLQANIKPPLIMTIRAVTGFSLYFSANIVFLLLFLFFIILIPFPKLLHRAIGRTYKTYITFLTRKLLPMLNLYTIQEQSGFDRIPVDKPSIIIANHRGLLDGPLLLSILKKTGVIMKSSYARLPVFSSLVKHFDFISVDPNSLESLAKAVERSKELISLGYNILIFPEGTRARTGRLLQFKDLAFRLASSMNIPVVPIIVHSTYPFMAKVFGSAIPPKTMDYRIRVLPIAFQEKGERPSEFASRIRKLMINEISKLDKGTVWENL